MSVNQVTTCLWCGDPLDPGKEEAEARARFLDGDFCSETCSTADAVDAGWIRDDEEEGR
ncbi:hypothetical protein [Mycobacteroides abscessus]|uniref:hypothetical protein n=1 Tax=Mycobacteroides abscessus TaxID=36809 RepID=UPI001390504D|nr:hypothetical protein [Mycobacteroides abscessus]